MKIVFQSFANISDVVGARELEVQLHPHSSLAELFTLLARRFGPALDRQIRNQITGDIVPFLILINGRTFRSTVDLQMQLQDGDTVTVMIPFDGG